MSNAPAPLKRSRSLHLFLMILLVLIALLLLILRQNWTTLVQDHFRPLAVKMLAETLQVKVEVSELNLGWNRSFITGLILADDNGNSLRVPRLELSYSPGGLLQRHFAVLEVSAPELIIPGQSKHTDQEDPTTFFGPRPDWTIDQIRMHDGHLNLTGAHPLRAGKIAFNGNLGQQLQLQLRAEIGPGAETLALQARGNWGHELQLTLEKLNWREQQLLEQPFVLNLSRLAGNRIALHWQALSREQLNSWLQLAFPEFALDTRIDFRLAEPRLQLSFPSGEPTVDLQLKTLQLKTPWWRGDLDQVTLHFLKEPQGWQVAGDWRLAGMPLRLQGRFSPEQGKSFQAELRQNETMLWRAEGNPTRMKLALRLSGPEQLRPLLGDRGKQFTLPPWRHLALRANLAYKEASSWQGKFFVQLESLELVPLRVSHLESSGHLQLDHNGLFLQQLQLTNELQATDLSATLALNGSGHLTAKTSHFDFDHLKLSLKQYGSPDGEVALAGWQVYAHQVRLQRRQGDWRLTAEGELTPGELLFGSLYGDNSDLSASFILKAHRSTDASWQLVEGRLALPGLATANLSGRMTGPSLSFNGGLKFSDSDRLLQRLRPALEDLTERSLANDHLDGRLEIQIKGLRRPLNWQLSGTVSPHDLSYHNPTRSWRIGSLEGVIPWQWRQPPDQRPGGTPALVGVLQLTDLELPPLQSGPLRLQFRAAPNRLQIVNPIDLPLAGGSLHLAGTELLWHEGGLQLQSDARLRDVDLALLSQALGGPDLDGVLQADLGRLRYADSRFSLAGKAELRLFSGQIHLHNMALTDPFSRYPGLQADIEFSGLDLEKLTRTLAFGEMNGIIDGRIDHLRLLGITPSSFEARLESRNEGERNISVKAINNLNRLSQGGIGAALTSGLYRFIDFYNYRKIGIDCRLHNDLFLLQGIARQGSNKVLIDGGFWPPKLDVLITSSRIPFGEMLKRLQRLQRTGN